VRPGAAPVGISLFSRKKQRSPQAKEAAPASPSAAPPPQEGPERLTANDWAKKHGLNEVMAERAAMRAGKWHDLFSEEEFLELLKRVDV
jgi:hypothetical protein